MISENVLNLLVVNRVRRLKTIMNINMQIKALSLKDKLLVMESIWDELCHNRESVTSPNWHKKLLEERLNEAKQNNSFVDWNTAKQNIRDNFIKS